MKQKNNGGFSLVEVMVAIAIMAIIVIPVCSSMVLSVRLNAKAEAVLRARLAVSSAVETLMAEGITGESDAYDVSDGTDRFPAVTVQTTAVPAEPEQPTTHYVVKVFDGNSESESLVSVTTKIRAAKLPATEEQGETP